jgi:PAS domain S-box-containing protein
MENDFKASDKLYIKRILSLADPIYLCDEFGYIKVYNTAAAELWGRDPEIGKDQYCGSLKIITPEGLDLPFENYPMAQTIKERKSIQGVEIIIVRPDGSHRYVMQYSSPIFNSSGVFDGAVNILIDVTGRKEIIETIMENY